MFAKIGEAIRHNYRVIASNSCLIDNNAMGIKPKEEELDPGYFYHFTRILDFYQLASSTTVPSIRKSSLAEIDVPLPPLGEQQRIAAVLDRVDVLREQRRQAIGLLDELAQCIFIEMFGSYLDAQAAEQAGLKLSDLATVSSGITKGRKTPSGPLKKLPYLSVANVQDRRLDLKSVKSIEVSQSEIDRYLLAPDDLLLTEGGDPDKLGRGVLWSGELHQCLHQNHIFKVRISAIDRIRPLYLNWLTASGYGKRYFLRTAKQTTGIASINKRQLSAFPILLPPFELQLEFENRIGSVNKQMRAARAHLAELDALFASAQWRAFRGELWETASD